eukprot:CAMPEP_0204235550 /NCGR_PEP_ID=MMETSP0361-20130328/91775_1 /ASSEMBLY_ACC=CAM_ASM_000343 /TAXON_ID=268821 /ORGANISM="Scrippsiella Hangoei, Strain SHTV-5" /LENGTH=60 /DNA_ID=CAMNT_0051207025 /DNA_START=18 /DNA_END=197 /DNA_ORIENTATION=-
MEWWDQRSGAGQVSATKCRSALPGVCKLATARRQGYDPDNRARGRDAAQICELSAGLRSA